MMTLIKIPFITIFDLDRLYDNTYMLILICKKVSPLMISLKRYVCRYCISISPENHDINGIDDNNDEHDNCDNYYNNSCAIR